MPKVNATRAAPPGKTKGVEVKRMTLFSGHLGIVTALVLAALLYPSVARSQPADDTTHIAYDCYLQAAISPAGDIDTFLFAADSGDLITLRVDPTGNDNFDARIVLNKPDGTLMRRWWDTNAGHNQVCFEDLRLAQTGTYTLYVDEVDGDQADNYWLSLQCRQQVAAHAESLGYDSYAERSASPLGDMDGYRFVAQAGDEVTLRVDPTSNSEFDMHVRITAPTGVILVDAYDNQPGHNQVNVEDLVLSASGAYIVYVDELDGDQADAYRLSLQCRQQVAANAEAVGYDTCLDRSIRPFGDIDAYKFQADSGDRITLRVDPTGNDSFDARIVLLKPDGTLMRRWWDSNWGHNQVNFRDLNLTMSGTYTLYVDEVDGDQADDYWLSLQCRQQVAANAESLSYDSYVERSASPLGDMDGYRFVAGVGDEVTLRVDPTSNSEFDMRVRITSPGGVILLEAYDDQPGHNQVNVEDLVLSEAGEYTVYVDECDGDQTDDYWLSLQCRQQAAANAEPLAYGEYLERSLSPRGEVAAYRFDGQAGDRVTLRVDPAGNPQFDARIELLAPDGSLLLRDCDSISGHNQVKLVDVALPEAGPYVVLFDELGGDQTDDYWLYIDSRQHLMASAESIALRSGRRDSLRHLADMKACVLVLSAPETLQIRMTRVSGTLDPYLELLDVNGEVLAFRTGGDVVGFTDLHLSAGTYVICCSDSGADDVGRYELAVTDAPTRVGWVKYPGDWTASGDWPASIENLSSDSLRPTGWILDWQAVHICSLSQAYPVMILTGHYEYALPDSERQALRTYVEDGGTLWIDNCGDVGLQLPNLFLPLRFYNGGSQGDQYAAIPGHPLFTMTYALTSGEIPDVGNTGEPWWLMDSLDPAYEVVARTDAGVSIVSAPYGGGKVVVTARDILCPLHEGHSVSDRAADYKFTYNLVAWALSKFEHDAGATAVSQPSGVVPPDTAIQPRAVVRNYGKNPETFRVMCRIGSTYSDTATVTLAPTERDTISFALWHATQRGTFVVACSTMLDGDEYPRNDKKTGSVTVSSGGLEIYSITPNQGGDIGSVTVDIEGAGFDSGCVAALTRVGQPAIVDSGVVFVDSAHVTALFNLVGAQRGTWTVVAVNPAGDSAFYYDGFTAEEGFERLWVDIIGRDQIRVGRATDVIVRYGNTGNVDAGYPWLAVGLPWRVPYEIDVPWALPRDSTPPSTPPTDTAISTTLLDLPTLRAGGSDRVAVAITPSVAGPITVRARLTTDPTPYFHSLLVLPDSVPLAPRSQGLGPPTRRAVFPEFPRVEWGLTPLAGYVLLWDRRTSDGYWHIAKSIGNGWIVEMMPGPSGSDLKIRPLTQGDISRPGGYRGALRPPNYTAEHGEDVKLRAEALMSLYGDPGKNDWINDLCQSTLENGVLRTNCIGAFHVLNPEFRSYGLYLEDQIYDELAKPSRWDDNPFLRGINKFSGAIWPYGPCWQAYEDQMSGLAAYMAAVQARDPNDKAGPTGFGTAGFVPPYEQFQYVIYFENMDTATAPAEDIVITDTLDADLDWTTFAVDTSSHAISSTNFDPATGVVTWRFDDINLPPNHNPPEGEGWLSYTINPKPDLPTGTEIRNRAWIVFDFDTAMATRQVLNTVDAGPPSSNVGTLATEMPFTSFALQLAGSDDAGGSGIRSYSVYVSDNDSAYKLWQTTESTSVTFSGTNGHKYRFYTVATDNVGHVEAAPTEPDAVTTIKAPTGVEVSPNPFVPSRGHNQITFFGDGLAGAEILIYNKAGGQVRRLKVESETGRLDWDVTSSDGRELASGVYIYVAKQGQRVVHRGKFAVIR